jgi:hypothetical protein
VALATVLQTVMANFLSLSSPLELRSDHIPIWLQQPGGINKDPLFGKVELDQPKVHFQKK